MKLWRLTRSSHQALDGKGAEHSGGRYSSPSLPVVSLSSEAGAAVLIAVRYWLDRLHEAPDDLVLGWTEIDSTPQRVANGLAEHEIKVVVDNWIIDRSSLLLAIRSKVLPEADVVLLNPAHQDAVNVPPLQIRPFRFEECLHRPPMLDAFREQKTGSD
ncbi:RES family NAD+ phosphorylase [Tsuneonella flava]|uniref:RES family NAD+ phosphorylase n=1 Tax=Tsuneonella flava TaxID=2055955 RepID=UPI00398B6F13